jgi:hypothetical protein
MKKRGIRFAALMTFLMGTVLLMLCVASYFQLPGVDEDITTTRYQHILNAYKAHIFIVTPVLALWLLCVAVILWRCSRLIPPEAKDGFAK